MTHQGTRFSSQTPELHTTAGSLPDDKKNCSVQQGLEKGNERSTETASICKP